MIAAAAPVLLVTANDDKLNRRILEKIRAFGLSFAEGWRTEMRLLVEAILDITPPASGKANKSAYRAGQASIRGDLFDMGVIPVQIKGQKVYTKTFWGHVLKKPLTIKTGGENPKFADLDAFHKARLLASHKKGRFGRVTRGGKQAFYVAIAKYRKTTARLDREIGKLAAGWIGIANELRARIASWIARHGQWQGTNFTLNLDPKHDRFFIHAINYCDDTVDPKLITDTQRRIEAAKGYRANTILRGLEGRAKRIARA